MIAIFKIVLHGLLIQYLVSLCQTRLSMGVCEQTSAYSYINYSIRSRYWIKVVQCPAYTNISITRLQGFFLSHLPDHFFLIVQNKSLAINGRIFLAILFSCEICF